MEWSTCSEISIDRHVFAMLISDSWQTIPGPGFSQTSNSDVQQRPWDILHNISKRYHIHDILAILQGCRKIIYFWDVVGNIPEMLFDIPIRCLKKTFWDYPNDVGFLEGCKHSSLASQKVWEGVLIKPSGLIGV